MSAPPDMSVLCKNWTPTVADRETVASLPLDKQLTLSVSLRAGEGRGRSRSSPFGVESGDSRALILSANVDEVTLFELRFWEGQLVLNAGTAEAESSKALVYGGDGFDFHVSFNPAKGGLAIVASWAMPSGERASHAFAANISNLKLPPARYYTLRLGAPKRFVDLSLLGWRVDASFDLAPAVTSFPSDLLEFVPTTLEEARKIWPPGQADAQTSGTASAIVAVAPLDSLRLALQSIDSWRRVAEDALRDLEGEAK